MLPAINYEAYYSKLDAPTPNGEDRPGRMDANAGEDFYEGVRAALRSRVGAAPRNEKGIFSTEGFYEGVRSALRERVGAAPRKGKGIFSTKDFYCGVGAAP